MRAVIVSGGQFHSSRGLRPLLNRADLIICADGGLSQMRKWDVVPQAVVGDFDSADARLVAWARKRGSTLRRFPREKDKTDTELALEYAIAQGVTEVDFLGALGGRIDHTLANVGLLTLAASRGLRARIVDGRTQVTLVEDDFQLEATPRDLVSLIALSETVRGVTTQGLKYPLTDGTLERGSSLGVSNEVIALPSSVRIRNGLLLIVITRQR